MSIQPTIYCDMDGVLCDFFSAVQKLTDQSIKSMSVSKMWALTRKTSNFWEDLEWMEGGQEIWRVVDHYQGHILSSLPYSDPNSEPGKREWLRRNVQLTDLDRIHLVKRRNAKQDFAMLNGVSNILIDDYIKNTDEWQAAGGVAIHNTDAGITLRQLQELGFEIQPNPD